jgi:protocatechuate 3,4-dioxygenase beta subunit
VAGSRPDLEAWNVTDVVPAFTLTSMAITDDVLAAYADTPDPRLREILAALIRHLHAFAAETNLTASEWQAGIEFLTAVGQKCDADRQEFILLSDVLGLSSLVESGNAADGATEPTVLGPFYLPGAPARKMGEHIGRPEDGPATLIRGRVTDTGGRPIDGATLDVWQCSGNGRYDIQDPDQPRFNLRGVFTTGPGGTFMFRTARPVSYPVPVDGPVGDLLRACQRSHWRASHLHAIVAAPSHRPVTTHIFDAENEYLDSDAVFGVRGSLIQRFTPAGPQDPPDVEFVVDVDFALAPV